MVFRSEESVSLPFLQVTDEDSVAIYLSDWLASDTVDSGQLERTHIGSCSLLSSVDVFDSLEFEAIRDYFRYPLSRYIAAYDVVFPSVIFTSMVDLSAFTREDQNEAIESVLNTYAVRYGDDYAASGWGTSPPASRSSSRHSSRRGRQRDTPCDRWRRPSRGGAFVCTASHGLVTPLMAVTASCDVLEAEASDQAGLASWVANIRAAADEMATRAADMLVHVGGD